MSARAKAAELLRYAAELVLSQRGAFVAATQDLGVEYSKVDTLAYAAWMRVERELHFLVPTDDTTRTENTATAMLEAAQRLEDGEL